MTRTVDRKPITQAMQLALWKQHGLALCYRCREFRAAGSLHVDHVLALVDGGAHDISNLRFICVHCHMAKSAHEHKENARAKRRAKKHTNPLPPGKIKSRGFDKTKSRRFDGRVVPRNPASADNTGA